jgi:hypothetical protein
MPAPPLRRLPLVLSAMLAAIFVAATAEAGPDVPPADGALVIVSDSSCPSAEAVREALVGLRPVGPWPALSVAIRSTSQMLLVEVGPQKTNPRDLAVGLDCAARATAVALVISTWTGDLPVEAAGTPILEPAMPLPELSASKRPADLMPRTDARQSEIGAGLLAATAGGIVPGGRLELGRMRRGSGLGWQVDLTVPAARGVALAGGTTRWMRVSAGAALDARWAMRKLLLDGQLGGVAALTYAWGRGYVANQSDWSLTWGLAAGIRAGMPWGRIRFWLDLHAVRWLREQSVQVDPVTTGTATARNLPPWDAQAAIGISYVFQ